MLTPHSDTDPAAERVRIEAIRRAPIWKRIRLASDLTVATRSLALADLRARFPGASEDELRRRLALRLFTPDEVKAAFGWNPESIEE